MIVLALRLEIITKFSITKENITISIALFIFISIFISIIIGMIFCHVSIMVMNTQEKFFTSFTIHLWNGNIPIFIIILINIR